MHWQQGETAASLDLAQRELQRFTAANELSPQRVQTAASHAYETVDEALVVGSRRTAKPNAMELLDKRPTALTQELRRDLGADDCLPVMRAMQTVRSLGLREHALSLMAIIFRRQAYTDTQRIFGSESTALRSVSVKWAAFETLQSFVSSAPN